MRIRSIFRSRRPSDSQSDAAGGHRFDNTSLPILVDVNFIGSNRCCLSGVQVALWSQPLETVAWTFCQGFYKHSGADAGLIKTDQIMGTYLSHFLAFLNRSGSFPVVSSFTRSKCLFACKGRTSTSASCADAINMLCIDFYVRRLVNHPFNRCPLKDSRSRSVLTREACLSKKNVYLSDPRGRNISASHRSFDGRRLVNHRFHR